MYYGILDLDKGRLAKTMLTFKKADCIATGPESSFILPVFNCATVNPAGCLRDSRARAASGEAAGAAFESPARAARPKRESGECMMWRKIGTETQVIEV